MVEQGKVVEAQHFDQQRGGLFFVGQLQPAVERLLRTAGGAVNAGDAVVKQGGIVTLRDKRYLVFEVCQPVVDWSG